jgi:hypothetical protein
MNKNTQVPDIQFAKNEGTSYTTQDRYESTMRAALLECLDQCVKCVFRHYKGN